MSTAGRECVGGISTDRGWSGVNAGGKASHELTQNSIHEWSGRTFAGAFDELDTLMDRGASGNTVEPTQLVSGESQRGKDLAVDFGDRLHRAFGDLRIK